MAGLKDLVGQTISTSGTSATQTLDTTITGASSFASAYADGESFHYVLKSGNDREVGIGSVSSSGTIFNRDLVLTTIVGGVRLETPSALRINATAGSEVLNVVAEEALKYVATMDQPVSAASSVSFNSVTVPGGNVQAQIDSLKTPEQIAGIKPTLDLDFTEYASPLDPGGVNWPASLPFSRATTATRINAAGLIEEVPANTPRIDYDPVTGDIKGLLIEQQATNLNLYSEDFTNGQYTTVGTSTINSNTHSSPRNDLTSDTISASATFSGLRTTNPISVGTNATITSSVFVKKLSSGIRFRLRHQFSGGTNDQLTLTIDLDSGVIIGGSGQSGGTITKYPNGWYRVTLNQSENGSASALRVEMLSETVGDFLLYGAQLEVGSYATSYIPTAGAQVTRTADLITIPAASFINGSSGTIFTVLDTPPLDLLSDQTIVDLNDNSFNNRIMFKRNLNTNSISTGVIVGGAFVSSVAVNFEATDDQLKIAFAWDEAGCSLSVNGSTVATTTHSSLPDTTDLYVGHLFGVRNVNSELRNLSYFSQHLSDTTLQELTK